VNIGLGSVPEQVHLHTLCARRDEILEHAADHGARNVRVFGSAVRGETGAGERRGPPGRDGAGPSLLDLVGLWQDLEDPFGIGVDVLSDGGVSPHLDERIYAEAVPL
jgi:predicted nucleotidyltransferase